MPEAVLVSALRAPIGTAVKGTLRDTRKRSSRVAAMCAGGGMGSAAVIEVPAP
jgi:acetyl-CoA acyltransferase